MPEVLRNGVTGFIVSRVDDLVEAVGKISQISRRRCREEFEACFTAEIMVANYERIYDRLMGEERVSMWGDGAEFRRDLIAQAVANRQA